MKHNVFQTPSTLIACCFGVGAAPVAAGTFGSLFGLLLYWPLHYLAWPYYLAVTVAVFLIGMITSNATAKLWGVDDPTAACIDEVVGIWLTLFLIPFSWPNIILGFALFRLFDIWKPSVIGWCDKNVHGGFGMMLDDVVAAIVSNVLLWVILWCLH